MILALEAALGTATCAVLTGGGDVVLCAGGRAAEDLATVARDALAEAGVALGELEQIVVALGPGSYMGVRAAVTTANALSFGARLPVAGVTTADAVAAAHAPAGTSLVAFAAGRGRAFTARYARAADGRVARLTDPVLRDDRAQVEAAAGVDALVVAHGLEAAPERDGDVPFSARDVLTAATAQPHLLTATSIGGAVPVLPLATVERTA